MSKSVIFVPSNENHVEIFWSTCRYLGDCRPIFVSQDCLKDEGAERKMQQLGIPFVRLAGRNSDPAGILRKEDAGAVVVGNDTDVVPQWFVSSAKTMGISSVLVQDGTLFDFKTRGRKLDALRSVNLRLFFLALRLTLQGKYKKVRYGGAGCTRILVWGDSTKSYLVSKGIDGKKIVTTGSASFNRIQSLTKTTDACEVLYIPTDLVHGNIVSKDQARKIIHDACSTILSSGNAKLTVKPHLRENRAVYEQLVTRYGTALDVSYSSPYELIMKAGIVITDLSTVAAEAMAAGKPVVIFLPGIEDIVPHSSFPRDLISAEAVLYARNSSELHYQVEGLMNGTIQTSKQAVEEMTESYFGSCNSDPAVSSANAIKSILS